MSIAADAMFPYSLIPSSQVWGIDNLTRVFDSGPTVQRGGKKSPRWACNMTFNNLDQDERRILMSFLSNCDGRLKSFLVPYYGEEQSAEIPELLTAPDDLTDPAWTQSNVDADRDTGRNRLRTTSAARGLCHQSFAVDIDRSYLFRAFGENANGNMRVSIGTSASDDSILASTALSGYFEYKHDETIGGRSLWINVFTQSGLSNVYAFCDFASVAMIAETNTGGSTGKYFAGKSLPGGLTFLKGGAFIEYNGEFKMLTTDLFTRPNKDIHFINITPAIRVPAPVDSPIVIHRPMCKMILDTDRVSWSERPHRADDGRTLSSFTVNCTEVF